MGTQELGSPLSPFPPRLPYATTPRQLPSRAPSPRTSLFGTLPGRQQEEKFYIPRAHSSELNHSHPVNEPPAGYPINAASGKLPGALAQSSFSLKTRGHGKRKENLYLKKARGKRQAEGAAQSL